MIPKSKRALALLAKRAKRKEVDVEDILLFARLGDRTAAPILRAVSHDHQWPHFGRIPGKTSRQIPFARWVDYVCAYLEEGFSAIIRRTFDSRELHELAEDGLDNSFGLGVVEAVGGAEAISALADVVDRLTMDAPGHRALALGCGRAISEMNVGGHASPEVETKLREFLHSLLELDLSPAEEGSVYCALREVGDENSIAMLKLRPLLKEPWAGTEETVIRAIRRRLPSE